MFMRKTALLLKVILLIVILLFFAGFAHAQKGTIKGVVKDENGPLSNASVTIEGKGNGTTTNDKGEYENDQQTATGLVKYKYTF